VLELVGHRKIWFRARRHELVVGRKREEIVKWVVQKVGGSHSEDPGSCTMARPR